MQALYASDFKTRVVFSKYMLKKHSHNDYSVSSYNDEI